MEKGFNDDELADIMSEIESLEDEFEETEDSVQEDEQSETDVPETEEVKASEEEAPVDDQEGHSKTVAVVEEEQKEVLEELSELPVEKSVPESKKVHALPVKAKRGSAASTAMQFHVEGEMTVELGFNIAGQEVMICVNEEDGLVITMDSGAKFTIPYDAHSAKKAA